MTLGTHHTALLTPSCVEPHGVDPARVLGLLSIRGCLHLHLDSQEIGLPIHTRDNRTNRKTTEDAKLTYNVGHGVSLSMSAAKFLRHSKANHTQG